MDFVTGMVIVFLSGMALSALTKITQAIAGRRASTVELAQMTKQLEEYSAAFEDAQAAFAAQATQLAEMQERLEFAERLLLQARERGALGGGSIQE